MHTLLRNKNETPTMTRMIAYARLMLFDSLNEQSKAFFAHSIAQYWCNAIRFQYAIGKRITSLQFNQFNNDRCIGN